MKHLSKTHKGELYALAAAIPQGLHPIFAKLGYVYVSSIFFLAIASLIAAALFAVSLTVRKKWSDILISSAWRDILGGTFCIGILYYGLIFWGLKYTTAGNASILMLAEIFFSFVFFRLFAHEKHRLMHILGAIILVFGVVLTLGQNIISPQKGDIIILLATMIPPLGNYFQQRARKKVSTDFLMFVRSALSGFVFVILSFFLGIVPSGAEFQSALIWIVYTGIFFFYLSKIWIIESFHCISVPRTIVLISSAPIFTLLFAYMILGEVPSVWQILGLFPIFTGIFLVMKK